MSVADLLTPLSVGKAWSNLNVNSINIGSGGLIGGPFHITETVSTGPSTITGDVGTFAAQLEFTTTNSGASYALVGPQVSSQDITARVKLYAANAPESTSGLFVDGNCKIQTFEPGTFIALLPNGLSSFVATTNGVLMPIQPYLEVKLPAAPISIPDSVLTPITTMTTVRSIGTISYDSLSGLFTVPINGVYEISYSATWSGAFVGTIQAYIQVVGDSSLYGNSACAVTNASGVLVSGSNTGSISKYLTGSTQFSIKLLQTTGGAKNLAEAHVTVYQQS